MHFAGLRHLTPLGIHQTSRAGNREHWMDPRQIKEYSDQAFLQLKSNAQEYVSQTGLVRLENAFHFANRWHENQTRKSGEPYIVHPLAVAHILTKLHMDETSLVAAILHDVVEDTHVSLAEVATEFGESVANLVDGLTKLARVEFRSSQEKLAENFRKMIVAMSKDIRVIIIKLADRLHNMSTIKALPLEKRQRIAEETLEIYAPLAGRLGIYRWKAELEDLCLKELKSHVYFNLVAKVTQKRSEREKFIDGVKSQLERRLSEEGLEATVEGRAKHFYSIYKKMADKQIEFEDIYDLFALRILLPSTSLCYEALGIVHNLFRPVPGRFKDYIAMPKTNLYQSLHTTVVAAKGELLEIQIRTWQMHEIAENGIAAHWQYKERRQGGAAGGSLPTQNPGSAPASLFGGGDVQKEVANDVAKFNWLKRIVNHQKELEDPNEFLEAVKVDLFEEEVYVFSPKGDVFEVQRGSTVLDFSFAVHSDLGLKTTGAKVNGRMVPLRTKVTNGDVVEIVAGNKMRPSKDWLSFVQSNKARAKIRAFFRSQEREEAKRSGQDAFEKALEDLGTSLEKVHKAGVLQDINRQLSVGGLDDFYLQMGYGRLDPVAMAQKITSLAPALLASQPESQIPTPSGLASREESEILEKVNRKSASRSSKGTQEDAVRVQGWDGIVVRMAKCCEPLPGQPIVGFVSRAKGVTIHTANCVWALSNDPARKLECSWVGSRAGEQMVKLKITTHDRTGILANITKLISTNGINIVGADIQTTGDKRGLIFLKLNIQNIAQLKDIHQKLEAQEGVIQVERVVG